MRSTGLASSSEVVTSRRAPVRREAQELGTLAQLPSIGTRIIADDGSQLIEAELSRHAAEADKRLFQLGRGREPWTSYSKTFRENTSESESLHSEWDNWEMPQCVTPPHHVTLRLFQA